MTTNPGGGAVGAGVRVLGPGPLPDDSVLVPAALAFVADLVRRFAPRVGELLERRRQVQARYDAGARPVFLDETRPIREAAWTVAPIPRDLVDRRVEITGPAEAKMIINALNSGASVFMADFEDSLAPTWANLVAGQASLKALAEGRLEYRDPATGKEYRVGERPATLMVRPRGWHLQERHLEVDGRAAPAALFDFGLFFFHNARALAARGAGPFFYLPKMQAHHEARLWNDVFVHAQQALGIPRGTIRATVLIETLPAAFEMDEILYELREHSAGLNCGRWDYIFSFIKTLRADPGAVLPDRVQVTMEQPFMRAYTQLLVRTCHRRGAHAMGGMAAQIPIRNDPEASRVALDKVRQDKEREVRDGHDGTWVAHPGLVPLAREVFDAGMKGPNQLDRLREDVRVTAADLIAIPHGTRTEEGLRHNVRVGVQYLDAWLRGSGCVPLYHLMEDAATAEISRTQVWQWIRHGASLSGGRKVDAAWFRQILDDEVGRLGAAGGRLTDARALFEELSTAGECADFLTLPAYERLLSYEPH
ncbi:MAG TPA: malate synthase A [Patescibacteria group bacterium]|nr:malate synthase A [Patescibacteria group bacterium]